MRFSRRQLLIGSLAAGLAACGRPSARQQALELWTLQLAPKFNDYFADVLDAWLEYGPQAGAGAGAMDRSALGISRAQAAGGGLRPDRPGSGESQPTVCRQPRQQGGADGSDASAAPACRQSLLPSVWEACRDADAGQIAVPWYLTIRLSLVNRRLMDRAGIDQPPTRWEQIPGFARRIRERTGRYGLFITTVPDDSAELLESLVQMGVTLLDGQRRAAFDSPAGREAFRFWTDLYREGLLPREVVSQGQRRAIELFQSGDLAMAATGAEFLRSIQVNAPGIAAATEPHPPLTGPDGMANVALMTLAVPKQSARAQEALDLALFLTNGANQTRFAEQARVLPSSLEALAAVRSSLEREQPTTEQERQIRQARLLSAQTLEQARVLVPALPGIKRLQSIVYTQLQRAMLGQLDSDTALGEAANEWNRYSQARWP